MTNFPQSGWQTLPIGWNAVVMQPTSLCNLNCRYCYLPDRQDKRYMNLAVIQRVADSIKLQNRKIKILWHGGEPLAAGISFIREAIAPFSDTLKSGLCSHSIQTNGTLINNDWCELFKEHSFTVGVSIDGNSTHTQARVTWANAPAFNRVIRGVNYLKQHHIPYGIIAVINAYNIQEPELFYEFLSSLCPRSISINIEESEGLNVGKPTFSRSVVNEFWMRLFEAWRKNPCVPIRQFRDSLIVMNRMVDDIELKLPFERNLYPTVDTDGNVVVLSPEFIAAPLPERKRFIIGNVLEDDLDTIIDRATTSWYVRDFFLGVEKCRDQCSYFEFCRGGQASNKYFEKGEINITETNYCYNSRIAPTQTILSKLSQEKINKEISQ